MKIEIHIEDNTVKMGAPVNRSPMEYREMAAFVQENREKIIEQTVEKLKEMAIRTIERSFEFVKKT